ncbi:MAG TPA: ATP-binding protein [Kofleriaceae bacterium]|nr:ATP-binding protein [Kofleriaceae bacterium]
MPEPTEKLATDDLLRMLVATVRDYAIFMLDPTGHVATWNSGAERIKGYLATEIIGRHFSAFYPVEEVRAGKCEYELEIATRDGRFEDEGWRIRKDGTRFWANVVITAVHSERGTLVGFAKVTRDLSERKRMETERTLRLAAEESNRAKDEFIAMLGHELRNPLAPIVTAVQLMRLRGDHGAARELQVIDRQVRHMMRLVDDLLDVARIARGKVELRREHVDLRSPVIKAIETTASLVRQRRHSLVTDIVEHELPCNLDETRITQVITNLITNAAKYTEPGGTITLAVTRRGDDAVIEVSDTGAGIDPSLLPHVFELFTQGPQHADRSNGGLGLGLALVRQLVELHGGRVEAHSAGPGKGSRFAVYLPIDELEAPPELMPHTPLRPATTRHRILLVDDNEDARVLLADILDSLGHDVVAVGDAAAALARAPEFAPDLAILDIGLPEMDGYELASRLRAALGNQTPKLVALTGYGQPGDRERSKRAGFHHHLVKPVDLRKLMDAIDS